MSHELSGEFPWGLLLIADSQTREQIPAWSADTDVVAVAKSSLVVRVEHAQEGATSVRVIGPSGTARGQLVFEGRLEIESGLLRVSDVMGGNALEISIAVGDHVVQIFCNSRSQATQVDLILDDLDEL